MLIGQERSYSHASRRGGGGPGNPQHPTQKVRAQTIGAEPETTPGEPGAIEAVARARNDRVEPDLQTRQPCNPNTSTPEDVAHGEPDSTPGEEDDLNTPVYLESARPEVLMEREDVSRSRWRRMVPLGKSPVLRGTWILVSNYKNQGSAALPRKRTPDHSPCHHHHHPLIPTPLGCRAHWPSIQGRWPPQNLTVARIWSRRRTRRRRQMRARKPLSTIHLADPSPHRRKKAVGVAPGRGTVAHDGPEEPDTGARTRARRPSERRTAALPTSPNHKRRAPSLGDQSLTTRRPMFPRIRRGGSFLTRVFARAMTRGPTWAS